MNIRKTKVLMVLSVLWILCAAFALTSATYAWFTASPHANVTPMEGKISNGDGNLLISNRRDADFGQSCTLILSSNTEVLHPVTTANLSDFFTASFQNPDGMTVGYSPLGAGIDSSALHGTVYLKSEGSACDVYLSRSDTSFGNDKQALGAMRLGMKISTADGVHTHIFRLDAMEDLSGIRERRTVPQDNTVVSSAPNGEPQYVSDPAKSIADVFTGGDKENPTPGSSILCTLRSDEVASVEYWLYLEGCDINCINDVQNKNLALQLGFAGIIK